MASAIFSGSKKSMEILFNVQPTLLSKNKVVPDLSEHDCTSHFCAHTDVYECKTESNACDFHKWPEDPGV
jgi:hypothetical protein